MTTFTTGPNGEIRESGVVSSAESAPTSEQAGLLSTARNQFTGGPTSNINEKTLVTIPNSGGMQVTLLQAEREGLVKRDAAGNYQETTQGGDVSEKPPEVKATEAQPAEAQPVPFAPEQEAMVEHLRAQLAPAVQQAAVEKVISGGLGALDMAAAETSGMDRAQFVEGAAAVVVLFQAQGDAHFRKLGVDPAEFTAWAHEKAPKEIKAAMRQHAASRSPTVYDSLVAKFLKGTAPDAAALNAGGYQTRTERGGAEMVFIPNVGWTTTKAAARAGLI